MTIKEILKEKGDNVITISAETGIPEAASIMAERKISALIVEASGGLKGIITERDIVSIVAKTRGDFTGRTVGDIMVKSENLIVAEQDDLAEHAMAVMIQKNIRHMPVVEDGELAGLVSIRDVVRAHVRRLKAQVRFLTDYVE